jgi:two-component system cell cycle sensor histidine kinase/response regulator CckA
LSASSTTDLATTPSAGPIPAVAVLLLDAQGRVTAANATARALWQVSETELIGESFSTLFFFEVVSEGADWLEAQWEVVLATTLERTAKLVIQPREGAPRDQSVRLEPALGGATGYIAVVQSPPSAAVSVAPEDGLTLLVEQNVVGFFDLNFTTNRICYSPVWKKLLGYVDAELPNTHETWLKHIHPEDSDAAPYFLGRKHTTGTRRIFVEFRMQHRRGHYVWLQCTGLQQVSAAGELERVTGFCLDVTERRELEEASLANDARLQDLGGATGPLGAFEFDFTHKTHWVSPAWCRLLGRDEDAATADPVNAFGQSLPVHEAASGLEVWFLNRAPGHSTFTEAVTLRAADGRPVPVLLGVHRILNRKRDLVRVIGFISALPEDISTPSTLNEAPALFGDQVTPAGVFDDALAAEAFAALAEAVLITDSRGQILFANPVAIRLLHRPAEQVPGAPLTDVFRLVNRADGRPGDNPIDRVLAADGPLPLTSEHALLLPGATAAPIPIVWTARATYGTDGKPRGVIIVFRDPDEVSLTPDELVKANRFESLGLLAGGIAHDFNNLLTTILGGVSLAKDNRDTSALGDAEKACMTAKGLTKQLLLFAKGGTGTQTVIAVKEIFEDTLKIATAGSVASVTLEIAANTDPVQVDRAQILQVFQNLVVNALQAMPPAPHAARVQLCARNLTVGPDQIPGLAAGDYVEFESRDNGSGIKPEYLDKIWDPFFTTKKHGTGLGLATVRSIVQKHGGVIGVDSTLGVGTVFTIYLPRADRPVEVQARRAASLRFGTGRILFMDDDEKISALTATMLTSLEYKYDLAKNGEEAITLYKRYLNIGRPYDAVIMDLTVIGGMGGDDCFRELKKLDPDVRAVVSSGYDNDEMAQRYLDMGFCGYLTKPYRVTDLGRVMKTVLG